MDALENDNNNLTTDENLKPGSNSSSDSLIEPDYKVFSETRNPSKKYKIKKESANKIGSKNENYNNMAAIEHETFNKTPNFYHKNCFSSVNNNLDRKVNFKNNRNVSAEFLDNLDSKLRNLNENVTTNRQKKMSVKKQNQDHRPMFVTTVKTGIFLDPPPELAAILGLNSYTSSMNCSSSSTGSLNRSHNGEEVVVYSFASQPRVLNHKYHRARCNAAKLNSSVDSSLNRNINKTRQKRDLMKDNQPRRTDVCGPPPYGNIMFDRRVVRGSTFAHHPIPTVGTESQAARQAEARRRSIARRKAQGQQTRALRLRLGTPPPVEGRHHENIQTENYLEELFDHPPGATVGCQTDLFKDRPDTPVYIPAKTGMDVGTQIHPGDLFDFDLEVTPILEVLVGKTIEQSLIEVLEEDELAAIKEQQRRYREIRAAEKAEELRLEEQERRRREECELRTAENEEACQIQKETEERVAAAVLSTGYIKDLLPSVLEGLKESGFLIDDIRQDVEENFMTWLMGEIKLEMQRMVDNRDLLGEIVREILETRAEIYRAMCDSNAQGQGDKTPSDEEPAASPLPGVASIQGSVVTSVKGGSQSKEPSQGSIQSPKNEQPETEENVTES